MGKPYRTFCGCYIRPGTLPSIMARPAIKALSGVFAGSVGPNRCVSVWGGRFSQMPLVQSLINSTDMSIRSGWPNR